jgi:serine protease
MYKTARQLLANTAIALLVAACGGGGGSGGGSDEGSVPVAPPEPPAPAPVPPPEQLFSISGTITAAPSQAVDWDNNDPTSSGRSNDTPDQAQPVPNPITLGGYVNQPETGAEGRSYLSGDLDDYFAVELLAGQSITMLVADFQQADADLYLYDTRGNILDFSIESGQVETLVIPRDGSYIVNAYAYDGATNYILAIGNQNVQASYSRQHFDIVPWQTVVKYRADADRLAIPASTGMTGRLGLAQRGGGPGRSRLMGLQRGAVAKLRGLARSGFGTAKGEQISDPQLLARWETLSAVKALRQDPLIEYAEPNYRVRALAVPDDEGYPFQWHYPLIDLPSAWDSTTGAPSVIVAVVDTGILSRHPDLRGQWVAGYDFVRDSGDAADGDGIDPDPEDPGAGQDPASNSFHGTHVSGTVAAAGDNRTGVAGVAYGARVMPLRALGADGGTSYDVDQAIRFAAGLANDSSTLPAQRADIINLSLGGAPFSQASQELLRQVRSAGVMVVAAAGNEGSSLPSYPASYDGVISVAAVDAQRRRTSYSNTGPAIDLAAPGGDNGVDLNGDGYPDGVLSTDGLGSGEYGYTFLSGTSMAAPHVAGVLALMKSVNPELSPQDVDGLLVRGELTDDLGTPGRDDAYGYGLINAQRAVRAALAAGGNPVADNPLLSASAATLNFSASTTDLELELRNSGSGELELLAIETSAPWLTVSPAGATGDGLGLYRVSVERGGLADGVYGADIIARSTVNSLAVRVIMSVGGDSASADVGVIYILLLDQDSGETLREFAAVARDGEYRFSFGDLPGGRYALVAGSDADNDLFICDAGEACGAWLTLDQPLEIDLGSDRSDINFPVDYLIAIPNLAASAQATGDSLARPPQARPTAASKQ